MSWGSRRDRAELDAYLTTEPAWRTDEADFDEVPLRPSWDDYFMSIAIVVAIRGDCTRRQVGAVIVDTARRIVSTGYNGAPSGDPGCLTDGACPRGLATADEVPPGSSYDTGPGSCIAVHAEANALLHGDATRYRGGTIYVTHKPCDGCRRLIRASGIRRVVWPQGVYTTHPHPNDSRPEVI